MFSFNQNLIQTYLINYTPYVDRKSRALDCLHSLGFSNVNVVNCFDREDIDPTISSNLFRWSSLLQNAEHIFLYNTLPLGVRLNFLPDLESISHLIANINREFLQPRSLDYGEISVCLKHYYAISSIANSSSPFGLICEDDILSHSSSVAIFNNIFSEVVFPSIDYLDLAGGCNLHPSNLETKFNQSDSICKLLVPRTRTSASYLLSKSLAKYICNNFMPLAMPIDWHIQCLVMSSPFRNFFWALESPFVHGSESGQYTSWRTNV